MNDNSIEGSQFCENCKYVGEGGKCINSLAKQKWYVNQVNRCEYFDGELQYIDWSKARPIGYRPSTFTKL